MLKHITGIYNAETHDIAGRKVYQPLPMNHLAALDPFLLLHHHGPYNLPAHNGGLPFGPHPHRGFETQTFIYSGAVVHSDSRGHKSEINAGGLQWMTAGMGIIHSENMNQEQIENGGPFEIIQVWTNLPEVKKMIQPKYQGFQKEDISTYKNSVENTQVISGSYKDITGNAHSETNIRFLNIHLMASGSTTITVAHSRTVLFYILNGELEVNGKLVTAQQIVTFDHKEGDIIIRANTTSTILFADAQALNEPVVAHGPFVMNTTSQIMEAMRDYQTGKMGVFIDE